MCDTDKTIKLWKVAERNKRPEGYNLKDEMGQSTNKSSITQLRVPVFQPMELMVEASPKRVFANAHTYHINSVSVNSDLETYLSADDLRINLWNLEITDQSFSILSFWLTLSVVHWNCGYFFNLCFFIFYLLYLKNYTYHHHHLTCQKRWVLITWCSW